MSLRVKGREWLWLAGALAVTLLLSSLPYLTGYAAQNTELVFSGAVFDRQDYAVHLATMHLGARGEWMYRLRFTSEVQAGAYMKLAYIFLGHTARALSLSLTQAYHLGRIVFGILAGVSIYSLASLLFSETSIRRLAWLLAFLGSGLGWLQLAGGALPQPDISPIDFWLTDAYVFSGLVMFPHFSAVTALLVGMIAVYLSGLKRPAVWKGVLAALFGVLAQLIQPYAPLLADLALAGSLLAWSVIKGRIWWLEWVYLAGIGLSQTPLLAYNLLVLSADPVWGEFARQNITLSPPLLYYLFGFGLFWPPALIGAMSILKRLVKRLGVSEQPFLSEENRAMQAAGRVGLLAWSAGALALAYAPTLLQRRFMHAYSIPLAFLAIEGVRSVIFPWFDLRGPVLVKRYRNSLALLVVLLASLSSLYFSLGTALFASLRPASLFDPVSLVAAVDWLAEHAGADEIILSGENTSRLVAARAGLPVYLGHPIETLDYERKIRFVEEFMSGKISLEELRLTRVKWVILGPGKEGLQGSWDVGDGLAKVYNASGVTVYEVLP